MPKPKGYVKDFLSEIPPWARTDRNRGRHPLAEEWDDLAQPVVSELCDLCEEVVPIVFDTELRDRLTAATSRARAFLYRRGADARRSIGNIPYPPQSLDHVPEDVLRVWACLCRLWVLDEKRPHIRDIARELKMGLDDVARCSLDAMTLGLIYSQNGRWNEVYIVKWPEGEEPPEHLRPYYNHADHRKVGASKKRSIESKTGREPEEGNG